MKNLTGSTNLDATEFKKKIAAKKAAVEAEIQRREKQKRKSV